MELKLKEDSIYEVKDLASSMLDQLMMDIRVEKFRRELHVPYRGEKEGIIYTLVKDNIKIVKSYVDLKNAQKDMEMLKKLGQVIDIEPTRLHIKGEYDC